MGGYVAFQTLHISYMYVGMTHTHVHTAVYARMFMYMIHILNKNEIMPIYIIGQSGFVF